MEKILENKYIDNIMKLFSNPNKDQLMKDIEIAKTSELESSTKFVNNFIERYSKVQIDNKIARQMIRDIILKLIKKRKDFYLFMRIYMNTADSVLVMDILKKHYILNNKNFKKIENGNLEFKFEKEGKNDNIEFGIDLKCVYNNNHFYDKFVKGILDYFNLALEENYYHQFVKKNFLKSLKSSDDYYERQPFLNDSLFNMLNDMNRVIFKDTNNFEDPNKKQENTIINKMPRNKYRLYAVQCKFSTNEEILKIYDDSETDEEIALKIDSLIEKNKNDDNLLFLRVHIENYLRNKTIDKKLKQIDIFKEEMAKDKAEIYFITKKLQDYEEKREKEKEKEKKEKEKEKKEKEKEKKEKEKLMKENAEMKSEITELKNRVNILEKKVNFMEPVVISLICRKVINYCMIKALEKYKSKIKIDETYNEFGKKVYKITFIDNVNEISKEDSNNLIDILFSKKNEYNDDSHLVGKDIPDFYNNIWNVVKERFNLKKEELIAFDAIFDDKIRAEFNFGAKDISVSDYLNGKNLNEFGKKKMIYSSSIK